MNGIPYQVARMISEKTQNLDINPLQSALMNDAQPQFDETLDSVRDLTSLYESAAERIRQQRVGPSKADLLFAISAAFGAPTKTGSRGETMANVSEALGKYSQAQREAQAQQQAELDRLDFTKRAEILKRKYAIQEARDKAIRDERERLEKAPTTTGGLQWNSSTRTWEQIPGYDEYLKALGESRRSQSQPVSEPLVQIIGKDGKPIFVRRSQAEGQTPASSSTNRPMSATAQKELIETEEQILSAQSALSMLDKAIELSPLAYEGPLASERAKASTVLPNTIEPAGAKATLEFDNLLIEQALPQMKAIFGANPTEGERAILLQIQGSSSLPKTVRDNILKRAKSMAQSRIKFNIEKAKRLRANQYFNEPPISDGEGEDFSEQSPSSRGFGAAVKE